VGDAMSCLQTLPVALGIASLLIGFASLPGIQARARRLVAHSTRLPSRDAKGRLYVVGWKIN
jgi:hypothetical protein